MKKLKELIREGLFDKNIVDTYNDNFDKIREHFELIKILKPLIQPENFKALFKDWYGGGKVDTYAINSIIDYVQEYIPELKNIYKTKLKTDVIYILLCKSNNAIEKIQIVSFGETKSLFFEKQYDGRWESIFVTGGYSQADIYGDVNENVKFYGPLSTDYKDFIFPDIK
jgi:hypothetical protein